MERMIWPRSTSARSCATCCTCSFASRVSHLRSNPATITDSNTPALNASKAGILRGGVTELGMGKPSRGSMRGATWPAGLNLPVREAHRR